MSTTKTRAGIALVIAALAAGCGSDGSTGPKSSSTLDLGAVLSQTEISDVNAIPDFSRLMKFTLNTVPPAITPSACSYSASAGGFTCPTTTVGDFTFEISYFLYDTTGQAQTAPDANTTAWVRLVIDATAYVQHLGNAGIGAGTDVVSDHEEMTLSGLLTPTRILNGTGTTHHDQTLTAYGAYDHTVADVTSRTLMVVLKRPSAGGPPAPTSGTITSDVTQTETVGDSAVVNPSQHGVITFDGSGLAKFVQTISGSVTATCTIDLSGKTANSCQ